MRVLLQRVTRASVAVDGTAVGRIGPGLLLLAGVAPEDDEAVVRTMAAKCVDLRIFRDDAGLTNRSLADVGGEALVVSQFTLFADTSRGRRPSFIGAAPPDRASALVEIFADAIRQRGITVATGTFGAEMQVELVNDGPMTVWLDSAAR